MQNKLERLIKTVYKKWKSDASREPKMHPDEEDLACFLEGRLTPEENEQIKLHLLNCNRCAEVFAVAANLKIIKDLPVPESLLKQVRDLVVQQDKTDVLEIIATVKERILELVQTSGDILWGEELVPLPILRSRQIKDFRDEITIFKDFKNIRVRVKIENKENQTFNVLVEVKDKTTQKIIKDLRVTLLKDDLELESYLTTSGQVCFEHILLGKYTIQISTLESKLASILLNIKS